jgi:hypothetical protein
VSGLGWLLDALLLVAHVPPPVSRLAGVFRAEPGGAPMSFSDLTLYLGGSPVTADVFGRAFEALAAGADAAAGVRMWGYLERGVYQVGDWVQS